MNDVAQNNKAVYQDVREVYDEIVFVLGEAKNNV